jgi:DNA ligase-1
MTSPIDAEFAVVRLEEGDGNWAGYAKRAVLRLADGREFGAGIKGDRAFTGDLLNGPRPYSATVRYFALSSYGVPRFPVATVFHWGERL